MCTNVLFLNQGASKPLEILQKTSKQEVFYASSTHFDKEIKLE